MLSAEFTATIDDYGMSGYASYLRVPDDIAQQFQEAKIKRFVALLNHDFQIHCAINSLGEGVRYIMISKRIRDRLDVEIGDSLHVQLAPDESEYGFPLPEEWAEILAFDDEAAEAFAKLTPGRQRNILHMVGSAKREETRINRALLIAENIKMGVRDPREFMKKR